MQQAGVDGPVVQETVCGAAEFGAVAVEIVVVADHRAPSFDKTCPPPAPLQSQARDL
jgi:hypothetical protein